MYVYKVTSCKTKRLRFFLPCIIGCIG